MQQHLAGQQVRNQADPVLIYSHLKGDVFVKCAERTNLRLQSRFSYASSVNPDLRMYTRMMMLSLAVIVCFTCQNAKLIPPNTYPARRLKCRKSLLCLPRKMTPCLDPAGPYALHVPDEFATSHHIIATRGSGLPKVTKTQNRISSCDGTV